MNEQNLAFFKEHLATTKSKILDEALTTVHDMQRENSLFADPNDRASQEADRITTLRIRDRERKLISKIDEALERIQEGSFGYCESCGEEIGVKRLEIRPVTTLCIQCKEEQEAQEKMHV